MAKRKAAKKSASTSKPSPKKIVDQIMAVIEALPEGVADLPPEMRERKHWKKSLSPANKRAAPVLAVLAEQPGFSNQAPKSNTRAAWNKVFSPHMGVTQLAGMLRQASGTANFAPVKRKPIKYWRDAYGPNETVQRVRPNESKAWLPNPHRGTTTFQRFQGEPTYPSWMTSDTHGPVTFPTGKIRDNVKFIPRTTLTYCRWPWSWLEPQKGEFRWDIIDNTLKAARTMGQTAQLRFQPYTQAVDYAKEPPTSKRHPLYKTVNVPAWYWDTGAKWEDQGVYSANEPDSNDPRYLQHFGDFIRAFAARYDGHPDLECIDMAYAGYWGESGGNSTPETAHKLTDIYLDSFKKTTLLSMLGTPGCTHASAEGPKRGLKIGWRADCFGDLRNGNSPDVPSRLSWNHTYDLYPKEITLCGVKEAWQTAPVTMETCGNVGTWALDEYDFDKIISEGYRYHMSVFMPKNVFFPERVMDKLVEFDKYIGYRFALRQMLLPLEAKPGAKFKAELFVDNLGCAPIYRPYKLALRFSQGKQSRVVRFNEDIRTWMPGHHWFQEELAFPADLGAGEVKVALGIVDETDAPRVWFAIDGKLDAGWHPLTSMDCLK